jgi:hypothetical protein
LKKILDANRSSVNVRNQNSETTLDEKVQISESEKNEKMKPSKKSVVAPSFVISTEDSKELNL